LLEVAAYTSSKSGVAGLTRALAIEWAARGDGQCDRAWRFSYPLNQHLLDGTERRRDCASDAHEANDGRGSSAPRYSWRPTRQFRDRPDPRGR
jgi:hypothetical protein